MTMLLPADDTSINGDLLLYWRIPPMLAGQWGEAGVPTPSSQNFRDKEDELSMYRADETTPEKALEGHPGFGLVSLTAGEIRAICVDSKKQPVIWIRRDDRDPSNGHVLVCGNITGALSKKLKAAAKWVPDCWPTRVPTDDE